MSSHSKSDLDHYYNTVLKLTKTAGQLIRDSIKSRDKVVLNKSCDVDLVTETDKQVEALLIKGLSSEFPTHKFIGEETVSDGQPCQFTKDPTWIIDPIDGTMNFVHTFPHTCVSIALFINQKPEIGIVYNPLLEQLFTARKGQGAFLNGDKIEVSNQKVLKKALVMMEFGTSREEDKAKIVLENQHRLMPNVQGLRSLGSAALNTAMVACGAADAYYEFGIHIWDFAAGELLVTEAGGVVMDPSGGPIDRLSRRFLAAANQDLADQLSKSLVQFYPSPRD